MARPISDEELQLKKRARRRLVGAIVLVSAIAVVLPMVLDSEPRSVNQNVDIHIPAQDSTAIKSRPVAPSTDVAVESTHKAQSELAAKSDISLPGAPNDASSAALPSNAPKGEATILKAPGAVPPVTTVEFDAAATAIVPQDAPQSSMGGIKAAPGNVRDDSKTSARELAKPPAKEGANGAFVVQVAALSDAARVKQLEKQMASAGLKTYTEVVNTKTGEVTRVRAGPYTSREAAERARTQLKKVGLDGKVVPK